MSWSEKYKKSINCKSPKGFSQKAHCAGRKKRNENKMKLSEFKEIVREISRNKFYESLNEDRVNTSQLGKIEFTKKGLTPTDVLSLAYAYKKVGEKGLTKLTNKMSNQIRIANDLAKLNGGRQLEPGKGGKNSLLFPLLKSKLINQSEYIDLIKTLHQLHKRLINSYLKGSNYQLKRYSKAAEKAAMKDMGA